MSAERSRNVCGIGFSGPYERSGGTWIVKSVSGSTTAPEKIDDIRAFAGRKLKNGGSLTSYFFVFLFRIDKDFRNENG